MDEFVRERLRSSMKALGLDGLVACSKDNVAYAAGYVIPSQQLNMRHRQFAVAVNGDGEAALLLSANEVAEAQSRSLVKHLQPYDELSDDPMEGLVEVLRHLGLNGKRIGIEMDALPAKQWIRLGELNPGATLVDGSAALMAARRVKSPRELEFIRVATACAHHAQAEAHVMMTAGCSEREVARWIVDAAFKAGAEDILMVQVASGDRSTYSNPTPTTRRMNRGEVVKIDVFVSANGYLSDTGHCVWVEEASAKDRATWAKVAETMDLVEAMVRPGTSVRELWEVYAHAFEERGLKPSGRFLGHGLGLGIHEEPFVAAHVGTVLEPNMVMAIEPVYIEDGKLFFLEDNLLVTDSGFESLTTALPHGMIVTPTTPIS